MRRSLLVRQVFPFLFWYVLLIAAAIGVDGLLHRVGLYWIGRYLGIVGSVLIVGSFAYSLRKRKIIKRGGALMILIHAGVHFNAVLPWVAVATMLVAVASGLTGKYLLKNARERLRTRETGLREAGMTNEEVAERLFLDSTTVDVMKKWRAVHIPITAVFGTLAVLHVLSILIFWKW